MLIYVESLLKFSTVIKDMLKENALRIWDIEEIESS